MNPSDSVRMDDDQRQFAGFEFINLETYKRDGQAVRTPVWFVHDEDCFLVRTVEESGKVKRVRNNPRVRIAPCDSRGALLGEWVEASACLAGAEMSRKAEELLSHKYGELKRSFDLIFTLRGSLWAVIRIDLCQ